MLSVFALMLVGCSNPANSGPVSDPYLLGLDDCEVTLAAIEAGVPNGWSYDGTLLTPDIGYNERLNNVTVGLISNWESYVAGGTDFKYYVNADFSTIVIKYKSLSYNCYCQFIKK